jgi:molybdenum-dependent DNA-binding transcriptional regulator ModE
MPDEESEVRIKPVITFSVNGKKLTFRQLEALARVSALASQTAASKEMGIAPPVLHRHIKKAEAKLGRSLVDTTATGTRLTELGENLVSEFGRYQARVQRHEKFTIGCTPITMGVVLEALSEEERLEPKFDVYIGDDYLNERLLRLGELDIVLFDDPVNVYMHEDRGRYFELFHDTLMHCDRGEKYVRYRYGAQRLGFKHLEFKNIPFKIEKNVSDINSLAKSGRSFFINRSISSQLDDATLELEPIKELTHAIMTLVVREDPVLDELIEKIRAKYRQSSEIDIF